MSTRFQIKCIEKSNRHGGYDRIKSIGGTNEDGGRWRVTQAEAITAIERGRWSFYVDVAGTALEVHVCSHLGWKFLKTTADEFVPNNLLSLQECPLRPELYSAESV